MIRILSQKYKWNVTGKNVYIKAINTRIGSKEIMAIGIDYNHKEKDRKFCQRRGS